MKTRKYAAPAVKGLKGYHALFGHFHSQWAVNVRRNPRLNVNKNDLI